MDGGGGICILIVAAVLLAAYCGYKKFLERHRVMRENLAADFNQTTTWQTNNAMETEQRMQKVETMSRRAQLHSFRSNFEIISRLDAIELEMTELKSSERQNQEEAPMLPPPPEGRITDSTRSQPDQNE